MSVRRIWLFIAVALFDASWTWYTWSNEPLRVVGLTAALLFYFHAALKE